ncbi:MAG: PQQ-binding-like beta-propeller repeat protein [Pirellulaceae bacterium]|nr:PQQ-binding-like beta-propeller repeat protein [Pirellulaceae bacterium]
MGERVSESNGQKDLAWWRFVPWVLAGCCILGLIWMRFGAEVSDFGFLNVVSYLLGMAAAFFSLLAMMLTTSRRVWVSGLLLPVFVVGVLLAFFRIDRVDSEIVPKFAWRWTKAAELPESAGTPTNAEDAFFAPSDKDYPQFLGPNANSTLPGVEVETNWSEHPPKIAWKQPIGKGWSGFVVQGNAAYTMEQRDQEEWVSCYDVDTGRLLWHYAIPGLHFHPLGGTGPRATPTLHEGRVYAQSAVSDLVCLDMRTGKPIWSFDMLKASKSTQAEFEASVSWGRSASPVIVDGKVIAALGGSDNAKLQSLIALDANNGTEVWRGGSSQISYSTPVVTSLLGQPQIVYTSESSVTAHSIADGAEMWSIKWPSRSNGDANVSQPVTIDDSHVLLSKGYGGGAELLKIAKSDAAWTAEAVWKSEGVLRTKFTSCVVKDGHAYGLNDGILECVNLENGKRTWKKGRYRHGQVLLVGETLVITAENGSVVLVATDPKELRELASLPVIGDVTWNTAALSGDRLLIRNSDEAACVILPLKVSSTGATSTGTTSNGATSEQGAASE